MLLGHKITHIIILWYICSKQELWSQVRQPLLGNGSVNIITAATKEPATIDVSHQGGQSGGGSC
jgi:hypothetical protein